jgi:hypothetical protein
MHLAFGERMVSNLIFVIRERKPARYTAAGRRVTRRFRDP